METKLIVSDIDGTLLQLPGEIPDSTLQLIDKCRSQGHQFTVCTGRSLEGTRHVAETIDLAVPAIIMTGSAIYDFQKEQVVFAHCLPPFYNDLIKACVQRQPDLAVVVNTIHEAIRLQSNAHLEQHGTLADRTAPHGTLDDIGSNDVYKLLFVHPSHTVLRSLEAFIKGSAEIADVNYSYASRHFVEIVSQDAGKDKALEALSNMLDIPLANTHYAGDGLTDLPAMRIAGTSSAPANANPEVQRTATWIFPPAKEHGLDDILQKFI